LLLLLALVAGGTILSPLETPGGASSMSDMRDKGCTSCGKTTAPSSCDAACIALPGIEPTALDLDPPQSQVQWSRSSDIGASLFIPPDTSPPRV